MMADGSSFEMGEKYRKKSWETIYLLTQKFCLPLMKGGRGMFHRTCDAMRTEHPPSPLHKGEVKVSSSILLPKRNLVKSWPKEAISLVWLTENWCFLLCWMTCLVKSWPNMRLFFFHRYHNIRSFFCPALLADRCLVDILQFHNHQYRIVILH